MYGRISKLINSWSSRTSELHTNEETYLLKDVVVETEEEHLSTELVPADKAFRFVEPDAQFVAKIENLRKLLVIVENEINKITKARNIKSGIFYGVSSTIFGGAVYLTALTVQITQRVSNQINDIVSQRNVITNSLGTALNFLSSVNQTCSLSPETSDVFRQYYNNKVIQATREWYYNHKWRPDPHDYYPFDACLNSANPDASYYSPTETYEELTGTWLLKITKTVPNVQEYGNLTRECFNGLTNLCQTLTDDLPTSHLFSPIFGIVACTTMAIFGGMLTTRYLRSNNHSSDLHYSDDEHKFLIDNILENDSILDINLGSLNLFKNKIKHDIAENAGFTRAATVGLLLMWQPIPVKEDSSCGLPREIGDEVGQQLTFKDVANILQTCKLSNDLANLQVSRYFKI